MVPPLESGDRLLRGEFERRYEAMPHLKKAELVDGVVYVPSPTRHAEHGAPHADVIGWLTLYRARTPGVEVGDNATLRLDIDNEPQPDALLRLPPELGGRSRIDEDGYVSGPPEMIVEVAASSASYDLHDKLRAYRRNGVPEYLVWRVLDNALDWFVLEADAYRRLEGDDQGALRSQWFPGLWLAQSALLARNVSAVLATLENGLCSAEHARYVQDLEARRTPKT